jgi:16S rRNA G966 N2-methylase RsmD
MSNKKRRRQLYNIIKYDPNLHIFNFINDLKLSIENLAITINNMYHRYTNINRYTNKRGYKKIALHVLFPLPPSKNYNNLMIDEEAVTFITTPMNSEMITSIIDSQIPSHIPRSDITILDGTACVGGDSISFGKFFGAVIATEIDPDRYNMLVNNLKEYDLTNVVPLNDDCLKIYRRLNFIDIIYLDPPWGGKTYKDEKNLRLTIGDAPIEDIILSVFNKEDFTKTTIRSKVNMVVLKLPKNYDLYYLYCETKREDTTMYLYELNKMNIVVIKKNSYI